MTTDVASPNTAEHPVTRDAALRKAIQLLEECQAALAASGDRRYASTSNIPGAPRTSTTRGLMYRIESFVDLTSTFVLGQ
jgi:hypothetical protein